MSSESYLEFRAFLNAALDKYAPDIVIPLERKGTALLRAAMSGEKPASRRLPWSRILSSEALELLPPDALKNRSILLFDEGMYSGIGVNRLRDDLVNTWHVDPAKIKVAAFSVHERASSPADMHFFGELTESRYRALRQQMIREFQRLGTLLLDTEHIAVTVQLNCGRLTFFDALSKCGPSVEHVSMGGRSNLTIEDPLLLEEREFLATLPPGTSIRNVVKKIRVVENRDHTFSIVPIFYPSTPTILVPEDLSGLSPFLRELGSTPSAVFHLTGLHGAIELLRTPFASLRELIHQGRVKVRVPRPGEADETLSHLLALFPNLDANALHVLVEGAVESGRSWTKRLKARPRIDGTVGTVAASDIAVLKWQCLSALRRSAECFSPGSPTPSNLTFTELRSNCLPSNTAQPLKKNARLSEETLRDERQRALFSAALDELIDDAKIVTDVSALRFADNLCRLTRTFRLDGEVVLSDMRKATAMWRIEPPDGV
jgi:hypothetical protein